MPEEREIEKAILQECTWNRQGNLRELKRREVVQFNPESLKLTTSNQVAGDNNKGGAALQFSSRGTTKLSFEMWFDVTAPRIQGRDETDVRNLTKAITSFMITDPRATGSGRNTKYTPPGCMFLWGNFLFFGVMESCNETLEFFSADGVPLRASVAVSLIKQDVQVVCSPGNAGAANTENVGSQSQQQLRAGSTIQDVYQENWQNRAREQGIEDPMRMQEGTFLPTDFCR